MAPGNVVGQFSCFFACQVFLSLVIMSSVRGHECMGHKT